MKSAFANSIGALVAGLLATTAMAGEAPVFTASEGSEIEQLPFKFSVSVRGGYDTNPLTNSGDTLRDSAGAIVRDPETGRPAFVDEVEESWFSTASLTIGKTFGGPRTSLDLSATAAVTEYWDLSEDDTDPLLKLDLRFSHAVTPKFKLNANAYVTYQSEPDFNNPDNTVLNGRRSGNYFYSNVKVSGSYRWTPKFSTVTSYNFAAVTYDDAAPARVEDRYENYIAQSFRYLLLPQTILTAQYRFGVITYDDSRGRDAYTHIITAGVDQRLGPKVNFSLNGGVQFRNEDGGSDRTAPYAEGTLAYRYAPGGTLSGFLRYGLENSSLPTASSENQTFRIGLRLNHQFGAKLSGNASLYYQNSDFSGSRNNRNEDTYNASVGLSYLLTEHIFLDASYTFSMIDSSRQFSGYERQRVSLGLGATF